MKTAWIVILSLLSLALASIMLISVYSLNSDISAADKKYKELESAKSQLQTAIDNTAKPIDIADLYTKVNDERTKRGLSVLKIDSRLEVSACAKAYDMSAKNYWSHVAPDGTTPWDFISNAGYGYVLSGENLAKEYNAASDIVAGWVGSPTHLENIVGNYRDMGICIIQSNQSQLSSTGKATNIIVNHFGR